MNHIKDFLKFVNESGGAHELGRLGLMPHNAVFINEISKILKLCPNIRYITYPDGLLSKTSVPVEKEEDSLFKAVWQRLIASSAWTPEVKSQVSKLASEDKYDERDEMLMQLGRKEFGDEEIEKMRIEASQSKARGISKMLDVLRDLDEKESVKFKIWDIGGSIAEVGRIPHKTYQDYDTHDVLNFLTENPELCQKITRLQIAASSIEANTFADRMASGEYGSVD